MGTIIKRKKSYQVQVSVYNHGVQKRLTKTFKTKAEAKHWEREMEIIMKGNGTGMAQWTTPFVAFYSDWVYFVKKKEVRETTFQNYERSLEEIEKLFNNIQLRNLNDMIVQSKMDDYAKTHSKRTTRDLLSKVKSALKYAHDRGYIPYDFTNILQANGTDLPNRNRVLSIEEYKKLLNYLLENLNQESNIYIYFVLQTGLRRGEALGIRPKDLYKNCIKVRHSICPTSDDTTLKTKSSYRSGTINENTYNLLKSIPIKRNGYIFDTNHFSQSEHLKEILKKLGIAPTTIQGLRRSHACLAYANTLDDVYVSNRLGHSSYETTHKYYLELLPENKESQDEELIDYLSSL